jgi:hypothetical protein
MLHATIPPLPSPPLPSPQKSICEKHACRKRTKIAASLFFVLRSTSKTWKNLGPWDKEKE